MSKHSGALRGHAAGSPCGGAKSRSTRRGWSTDTALALESTEARVLALLDTALKGKRKRAPETNGRGGGISLTHRERSPRRRKNSTRRVAMQANVTASRSELLGKAERVFAEKCPACRYREAQQSFLHSARTAQLSHAGSTTLVVEKQIAAACRPFRRHVLRNASRRCPGNSVCPRRSKQE